MTNGQEYKSSASVGKNFMTYCDGDKLFHYTKFDSALKIIISNKLRFGRFEDMNDIAEVNRDIFANIPLDVVYKELGKYQSISLTTDKHPPRGFEINPLWGHYADKGKGVCLVFDKAKLLDCLTRQIPNDIYWNNDIHYENNFSNRIFPEGDSLSDVALSIQENIGSVFFSKSSDWQYEQEYRLLVYSEQEKFLNFGNSLQAVILCLPKIENIKETAEYTMLKKIIGEIPILHYTTSFGENILNDENGNRLHPVLGVDWNVDTE